MKNFSMHWKESKNPRKQRKYMRNAPLHIRKKFMSCSLSKELRKKYGMRNIYLRKGDNVMATTGQFKKLTGKVNDVDMKNLRAYVDGAENIRKDGTKRFYPIHPSNLMIIELNIDDKKRKKILERKSKK